MTLFPVITIGAMLDRRVGLAYALLSALVVAAGYALEASGNVVVNQLTLPLSAVVTCAALATTGGIITLTARLREDATTQYAELVRSAPEGILTVDAQGLLRSANPAACALFAADERALTGRELRSLLALPAGAALAATHACTLTRADGRAIDLELELTPLHRGRRVALRNVSARNEAERERARLTEQLHQAQKLESIALLAGGVAHDFNNLITAILASVELLKHRPPAAEARELLEDAEAASQRAAQLTRQLLAYGRRQVLRPRALRPNDVVTGLQGMLRRLLPEHIELRTQLDAAAAVFADAGQLEQVLINLVINARDAMPEGGVITISTADVPGPVAAGIGAREVAIVVQDSGSGIVPELLERIFDPFFTTKPVGQGSGLGLAVVRGIVEQSGGRITAASTPGAGAHFEVRLPAADPDAVEVRADAVVPVEGRADGTVLVIEDEPALRRAMSRFLRDAGLTVVVAADGEEGVRIAAELPTLDLVVTDVIMPRMGGAEAVRRLREERPGLRALFVSGYTERTLEELGAAGAGASFLAKPFQPAALVAAVRRQLR